MSGIDLDSIRARLRQLDVLSGLIGLAPRGDFDAICEDLAINEVAGLVHEVEQLRAENAAMRVALRKHYPTIAGHAISLDNRHEERAAAEWREVARELYVAAYERQQVANGPVSATPAVTPAGLPSASP